MWIVAAWEGKPDSFRASVLKGMMHFVELYHGEFNEERLLRALRNIHPVDIYRIGCVGTAFRLYKQMGEPLYCETMRLIVAAWEGKPDSFRASVLKGMMHFVELYHGEFSEERLLRALRSIHPVDVYRIGQDDPAKLRGWKKYVFPIYTAYNGKCRKDSLPMKF